MFTKTTRQRPRPSARSQTRVVCTSTPLTPLTTTRAPSTTRSAARASAWKPGSPGASTRLIFRPCHSRWQSDAASDIWRLCSSSSQSETVEEASTVPSRLVAPAWKREASTREVLPVPRCPTTATLRILLGSNCGTEREFTGLARAAGHPGGPSVLGAGHARRQPRLEAEDRLRVQLGDARLRDAQDLPDLPKRQLFVVVERHDELLALRQARDRVAERLAQLRMRHGHLRLGRLRILDRVDEGDRIAAGRRALPELVERRDRRPRDLGERVLKLLFGDAQPRGDLLVGRRPGQLRLEGPDRPL